MKLQSINYDLVTEKTSAIEEEIAALENQPRDYMGEIEELKRKLFATDYLGHKWNEGQLSYDEWEEAKKQRQAWRDEINALEVKMQEGEI